MPLTPADVHNVAFKKPPIGKRGYDEDEVDAFLDLVEAEFARLIEENAELKGASNGTSAPARPQEPPVAAQEAAPVQQQPAPVPDKAAAEPAADLHSRASRTLALATETADRHIAEAKAESDKLVSDARTSSDKLLGDSKAKSDQLLNDGRTKSEAMVAEAKTRAESLERDARAKSQTLTADAERKQTEIMGSLEQRKSALEKQIDDLRNFEREYRTRLKSYLETQLRDLDSRSSAEPAGTARPGGQPNGAEPNA